MCRVAPTVALAALISLPATAEANGRFPATVNAHDRPGDDQMVLLAVTFGLLLSTDGGASFWWVCENAVGYGGTFDPDYAVAADGAIYATTFDGLKVSRDGGCTFNAVTDLDRQWVGEVEVGPDGTIWAATSSGGMPNDVYRSDDGGASFAPSNLYHDTAWWKSLRVAPSDPDRIYVTGYLVADAPEALLRRSDNGGAQWVELAVDDFAFSSQPQLFIEGVMPNNPDIVFARVAGTIAPAGDAIYRSADAGESWTQVLELSARIGAFIIMADGTVMAATTGKCPGDPMEVGKGCVRISTDGGVTWSSMAHEPKAACLMERSDGALFACGTNWDPDQFALGRWSAAQMKWNKVFRFSEMAGPLSCEPGTIQYDICESLQWSSIAAQFGVGTVAPDAGVLDAEVGAGGDGDEGGCGCSIAFASVLLVIPRRRTRRLGLSSVAR